MHAWFCVLLTATCALASESQERRSKLPYIADAVGNSLPAPSNVPAKVGSPVNLISPDRYEFYTFDESGELVKRLMTLEEIQAIVAGEEADGLVTFANDDQPTVAFNFSQPSYTKVHNVVTNVQNVLKAQMEAHKNKSNIQPTLDTPDVSDSWSQILPSIFGNTGGVDIIPDRTSDTFITPETETIEFESSNENALNKENEMSNKTINDNTIPVKLESTTLPPKLISITKTTTTTNKPTSTTTRKRIVQTASTIKHTTLRPTTSRAKLTTPKTTTKTTTRKLLPSTSAKTSTTVAITSTTIRPKATLTTKRPLISSTNKYKSTTKLNVKITGSTKDNVNISNNVQSSISPVLVTKINPPLEKLNTIIPMTTSTTLMDKTTEKPSTTTQLSTPLNLPPSSSTESQILLLNDTKLPIDEQNFEKINITTITTQSISPSTTASSMDYATVSEEDDKRVEDPIKIEDNINEPDLPLFDVAQSISQIASDLGNYAPQPSSDEPLDTNKLNTDLESKESLEIDIPPESELENKDSEINNTDFENFVKISTLDPQNNNKSNETTFESLNKFNNEIGVNKIQDSLDDYTVPSTTIVSPNIVDSLLYSSVGDMLSQVINENPMPQAVQNNYSEELSTTYENVDTTTFSNELLSTITTIIESDTTPFPTTDSIVKTDEGNDKKTKKNEEELKFTQLQPETTNIITKEKNKYPVIINNNTLIDTVNALNIKNIQMSSPIEEINKNLSSVTLIPSDFQLNTNVSDKLETTTILIQHVPEKDESFESKKVLLVKNVIQNNNVNKFKTYEEVPKMDEFKKKIQKVNIDDKELATDRNSWKLIATVPPPKSHDSEKVKQKIELPESTTDKNIILDFSNENQGLEVTTKYLEEDVLQFTELCNELAFRYWQEIIQNIDNKRSFVLSPYSITSMLAMMFMGARGATSGEMNEILKLDDMVTFNPHFTLKNISDSIETSSNSGVSVSAFIRELYSERSKGKILTFYKERAQQFYNGHVEEINFKLISDIIRRRTNLLVKRYTWGKIPEYLKSNSITMHPPLAAFSANIFETDCTGTSVDGRDGEMYFVVSPNVRQRRLVPVPAVVYKNNFLAGYDPILDATAVALGNTNSIISTLFLMPGQQGNIVNAEDLEALEKRFLGTNPTVSTWNRLLRTLLPRIGLELQIPRFSHKSMLNVSSSLKNMGLKELFDSEHANLAGLNGPSKDIYLSDMMQLTTFVTCGEGLIGEQHHVEEYPEISQQKRRSSRWATMWDEPRDYQRAFHDPHDLGDAMHLPLHLRPRQARLPARNTQPTRLKFDRPFLYFVRHNPTGMILYVGRFNPRLLP